MTLTDILLITKKIGIGILIIVIPFAILYGGLWLLQAILK